MDGVGTLVIFDPNQPGQPRYAVQDLAVATPLLLQLAPDGHPQLRLRCPEAAVPVPVSVGAHGQLPGRHGYPPGARNRPLATTPPRHCCLTDSTLECATPRQLVRLRHWQQPKPAVQVAPLRLSEGSAPPLAHVLEYDKLGTLWLYSRIWRGCYKQRPVVQALRTVDPAQQPRHRAPARRPPVGINLRQHVGASRARRCGKFAGAPRAGSFPTFLPPR